LLEFVPCFVEVVRGNVSGVGDCAGGMSNARLVTVGCRWYGWMDGADVSRRVFPISAYEAVYEGPAHVIRD